MYQTSVKREENNLFTNKVIKSIDTKELIELMSTSYLVKNNINRNIEFADESSLYSKLSNEKSLNKKNELSLCRKSEKYIMNNIRNGGWDINNLVYKMSFKLNEDNINFFDKLIGYIGKSNLKYNSKIHEISFNLHNKNYSKKFDFDFHQKYDIYEYYKLYEFLREGDIQNFNKILMYIHETKPHNMYFMFRDLIDFICNNKLFSSINDIINLKIMRKNPWVRTYISFKLKNYKKYIDTFTPEDPYFQYGLLLKLVKNKKKNLIYKNSSFLYDIKLLKNENEEQFINIISLFIDVIIGTQDKDLLTSSTFFDSLFQEVEDICELLMKYKIKIYIDEQNKIENLIWKNSKNKSTFYSSGKGTSKDLSRSFEQKIYDFYNFIFVMNGVFYKSYIRDENLLIKCSMVYSNGELLINSNLDLVLEYIEYIIETKNQFILQKLLFNIIYQYQFQFLIDKLKKHVKPSDSDFYFFVDSLNYENYNMISHIVNF